ILLPLGDTCLVPSAKTTEARIASNAAASHFVAPACRFFLAFLQNRSKLFFIELKCLTIIALVRSVISYFLISFFTHICSYITFCYALILIFIAHFFFNAQQKSITNLLILSQNSSKANPLLIPLFHQLIVYHIIRNNSKKS